MTQSGLQPPLVRIVPAGSPTGTMANVDVGDHTPTVPHRTPAQIAKDIGLFFAAPFVTLACVSLFPFIGMAMLLQAWRRHREAG